MSDWEKLAIIHVAVGIETNVLGLLGGSGSFSEVEALLIIAFLLYLTSIILLILAVAPEGDLKGNKAASICCICFLFSAGKNTTSPNTHARYYYIYYYMHV